LIVRETCEGISTGFRRGGQWTIRDDCGPEAIGWLAWAKEAERPEAGGRKEGEAIAYGEVE